MGVGWVVNQPHSLVRNQVRFPEGQREITQGGTKIAKFQAEETECRIVCGSKGKFWALKKMPVKLENGDMVTNLHCQFN